MPTYLARIEGRFELTGTVEADDLDAARTRVR